MQDPYASRHVTGNNAAEQPAERIRVHGAEHLQHVFVCQFLPQIKCDALIQQAQRVTHGTVRRLCNVPDGPVLRLHAFDIQQFAEPVRNGIDGDPVKIIALTAGKNRDRDFVDLGCREDKNHVFRRFLQRFQQRIESAGRKHVHLINDVHLVLSLCRPVGHFLADLTHIIHAVVRRGIDLDHIRRNAVQDIGTEITLIAGAAVLCRIRAVHRSRKNLRHGRLAGASCPAEQIGVSDPAGLQLISQRGDDMILSLNLPEGFRPEFSVKCLIAQ